MATRRRLQRLAVTLTVTNTAGVSSTIEFPVHAGRPGPEATILEPLAGANYATSDVIHYAGSGVTADGADMPAEALSWQLRIHYPDRIVTNGLPPAAGGQDGSFFAADRGETGLELCLTVTGAEELADTTCTVIDRR